MGAQPEGGRPGQVATFVVLPLVHGMAHTLGPLLRGALADDALRVDAMVSDLGAAAMPGRQRLALRVHTAAASTPTAVLVGAVDRLRVQLQALAGEPPPPPVLNVPSPGCGRADWPDVDGSVLTASTATLQLSVRAANCLATLGVACIGDLLACTETDLLRTPNLGRRCLQEIQAALAERGLVLAAPHRRA